MATCSPSNILVYPLFELKKSPVGCENLAVTSFPKTSNSSRIPASSPVSLLGSQDRIQHNEDIRTSVQN